MSGLYDPFEATTYSRLHQESKPSDPKVESPPSPFQDTPSPPSPPASPPPLPSTPPPPPPPPPNAPQIKIDPLDTVDKKKADPPPPPPPPPPPAEKKTKGRDSGSTRDKQLCINCQKHRWHSETSRGEKICVRCLKALSRATCKSCLKEFHVLERDKAAANSLDGLSCESCKEKQKQHGEPTQCSVCQNFAAFGGSKCSDCLKSEKSYGQAVICDKCLLVRAFNKPSDRKRKVDGMTLCLVCTRSFKREQHESNKGKNGRQTGPGQGQGKEASVPSRSHDQKRSSLDPATIADSPAAKKPRLATPDSSKRPAPPQFITAFPESDPSNDQKEIELLRQLVQEGKEREQTLRRQLAAASEAASEEGAKLEKSVETLKRQLMQKEREIGEARYRMEQLEKESNSKIGELKRSHQDVLFTLTAENKALRSQMARFGIQPGKKFS